MGDQVREAAEIVRGHLGEELESLRARLGRYRAGDRLGGGDAETFVGGLLRLRALAPLAGLPPGAADLLAAGALDAQPLARALLRFEALLDDEDSHAPVLASLLEQRWRRGVSGAAVARLRQQAAQALARAARMLTGPGELEAEALDGVFRQCGAALDFLGQEAQALALLECRVMFHRGLCAADVAARARVAARLELMAGALEGQGGGPDRDGGDASTAASGMSRDPELAALALREFARLAPALCPGGASRVRESMLYASYRLHLHCRSLGLSRFADAFASAERLLLAHWNAQAPLDARSAASLRELAALLLRFARNGGAEGGKALLLCELALLRALLRRRGGEAFQGDGGREPAGRAASRPALPLLMPRHLVLLPCAAPAWVGDARELRAHLPALLAELEFLERGAARLRVFRIEALAGALREVYADIREAGEAHPAAGGHEGAGPSGHPLPILARAHQRLRAMLNQAAAWQEVSPAPALVRTLHAWVEARREAEAAARPNELRGALHRFAAQLCAILDRQLHLEVSSVGLSATQAGRAREAARALLRLLLGSPEESPWRRRARGTTAALSLRLRIEGGAGDCVLTLDADQAAPCVDAARFLRRQIGKSSLRVERAGDTWRYTLSLPMEGRGRRARHPAERR